MINITGIVFTCTVFNHETAQWSSTKILNSREISSIQYRNLLLETFLEVRQIGRKHISMSVSLSENQEDLIQRLQEAEERIQEAHKQKTHFEEELRRVQEVFEIEKNQVKEQKNDFLKKKDVCIKELEGRVKQLEASVETITKEKSEEASEKNEVIKIAKKDLAKQKRESEEILANNSNLQRELQEKIKAIEKKDMELEMKNSEMSKLAQDLQQTKQQLEEVQSKNEKMQKEKDDLAAKPQWMVIEEEVEMTEDIVGKGSYGEVKIANFRGTKVAAKSLHNIIMSEYNSKLFNREMDMCSKLHHPNIVQFIAATDGNTPVLLYELMETSLHDRMAKMQKNQLTQKEILDISTDVLLALAYLHAWKPDPIIHRDISSSNVLMEQSGENKWRSKLSDFGSANLQRYTATSQPGNPHYAAPEACFPKKHTTSMDIYSLGVLIIEMVNHEPPKMQQDQEKQVNSMGWTEMGAILINCIAEDQKIRPRASGLLEEVATLSGQIETID